MDFDLGNIEPSHGLLDNLEAHCRTPKLLVRQCSTLVACSRPYGDLGLAICTGNEDRPSQVIDVHFAAQMEPVQLDETV